MTTAQAEEMLLSYPSLWLSYYQRREQIIHGGRSSADWASSSGRGGGGYSDKTASKAIRLAQLACNERTLQDIGKWLDDGLQANCRGILVSRWRQQSWQQIARGQRQTVQEVKIAWSQMIEELAAVIPFAGRV